MKKALLLLASAAMLLVSCRKEQIVAPQEDEMTVVSFTANVNDGVATKADNDGNGTKVNRCIVEIYFQNQLYKRLIEPVSGKVASFTNVPVVVGKEYQIVAWADYVDNATNKEGLATDKYYKTTDHLKSVTVNSDAFCGALAAGKNDELDAFFGNISHTFKQHEEEKFNIQLTRPFAQLKIITTDVAADKTIICADLLPDNVSVSYKAANKIDVTTGVVSGEELYEYVASVYGSTSNWPDIRSHGELTLSMDYILASTDKSTVDVTFKILHDDTEVVMTHSLSNLPFQRNYRTNVKGDLLTVGGSWTATVDPGWGMNGDGGEVNFNQITVTASSYTDVEKALQSGNESNNLTVTVTPEAVDVTSMSAEQKSKVIEQVTIDGEPMQALKFVLYEQTASHPASPEHVEFELPARPNGVQAWKIEHETAYPTETVVVSTREENDANIIIEAPRSTVTLDATKINSVVSTTSENTLIIPKGLELKNLTVKKGAVEYHGEGLTNVTVDPESGDNVYFKASEGLANTDNVYGVVKDYVAEGYIITKESETTWKIVPTPPESVPVAKIGTTQYYSLSDALFAAKEGEAVYIIPDQLKENVTAKNDNNIQLILDGKIINGDIAFGGKGTLIVRAEELNTDYYHASKAYDVEAPTIPAQGVGGIMGKISATETATVMLRENLYSGPFEGNVELRGGFYYSGLGLDNIKARTPNGIGLVVDEIKNVQGYDMYYVPEVPESYLVHIPAEFLAAGLSGDLTPEQIQQATLGYWLNEEKLLNPYWVSLTEGGSFSLDDCHKGFPDDVFAFFTNLKDNDSENPKYAYQNWVCDFVISYSQPIAEDYKSGIWGYYSEMGFGCWLPKSATNNPVGLMRSTFGPWAYSQMLSTVGMFLCGPKNLNPADAGKVITVELNIYPDSETDKCITTNKVVYTIPAISNN